MKLCQVLEVERSVVRSEPLGDVCGRCAPKHGSVPKVAAERAAAEEAGGERVAAAGRVDHVDLERRARARLSAASTTSAPSAPRVAATQPTPCAIRGRGRAVIEIGLAREPEHLLVVREQVVEVRERGRDPVADRRRLLTGREQVGARDDAVVSRAKREDLRRLLAAHELGGAEVQMGRGGDRVIGRVGRGERAVGADDVERRARAVGRIGSTLAEV